MAGPRRAGEVFSPIRFLWFAVVLTALVLAAVVIAVELGAIVPGLGLLSATGSFVLPILGPVLVVAALPAVGLGLWRRRHGPRRTATAAAAAGAAGAVTGIVVIAIMMSAVSAAGGSVNIFRALAPSSAAAASPSASTVYDTVDGQTLSVTIYRPSGPPRRMADLVLHPRRRLDWRRKQLRPGRFPVVRRPRLARHQRRVPAGHQHRPHLEPGPRRRCLRPGLDRQERHPARRRPQPPGPGRRLGRWQPGDQPRLQRRRRDSPVGLRPRPGPRSRGRLVSRGQPGQRLQRQVHPRRRQRQPCGHRVHRRHSAAISRPLQGHLFLGLHHGQRAADPGHRARARLDRPSRRRCTHSSVKRARPA